MIPREFLFGKTAPARPLTAARAQRIVERARAALDGLRAVRTRRLLDLFAAVGRRFADPADPLRQEAARRLPDAVGYSPEMVDHGFAVIAGFLSRDALLARLSGELRAADPCALLDGFSAGEHFPGTERALPLGVLLNVAPGNVFVSAADAIVAALLARNALIFKCPADDPVFPPLFAEALADADGGGPVSAALAVLHWRGGDPAAEEAFKRTVDAVAVWGGEGAVAAWRAGLPASARLIEYGPKYSFAFLDLSACRSRAALDALAAGIARDVAVWDGHACSSPQCLFVVESSRFRARDLRDAVAAALRAEAERLPPGPRSLDEKVELLRLRERGRIDPLFGSGGASGDGTFGIVLEDAGTGLPASPRNRALLLRVVPSAEAAAALAGAHRGLLQACALSAPSRDLPRLADLFAAAGVNRVTAPGRMGEPDPGAPHDGRHPLADLVRFVTREEADAGGGSAPVPPSGPTAPNPDSIRPVPPRARWNGARESGGPGVRDPRRGAGVEPLQGSPSFSPLTPLLAAARRAPFYRRRLSGIDPARATAADLARIVPVTREEIAANAPPASSALLTRLPAAASVFASGGTKGRPKYAYYAAEEFAASTDALAFIYERAGIGPGDRVGNLFLAGSLWTSFLVCHAAVEKAGGINLPVAGNAPPEESLRHLVALSANALIGLPSSLLRIAEEAERGAAPLRVAKILYGGEHLYPDAAAYLKKVLGARVIRSAGYATVDCGPVGWQCDRARGTVHHALDSHCVVEVVDAAGRPAAPGKPGELVVTNLARTLQPVIRFRTGDAGRFTGKPCRCGHPAPLFELLGRVDDTLVIGGMNLHAREVAEALAGVAGLTSNFSLVADTVGRGERLSLLLETRGAAGRRAAAISGEAKRRLAGPGGPLAAALAAGWLAGFAVRVVPPAGIPRNARTGKVVTIVDRRKPE